MVLFSIMWKKSLPTYLGSASDILKRVLGNEYSKAVTSGYLGKFVDVYVDNLFEESYIINFLFQCTC